jgi:16S rRNA G1207 methylase RsmC
MLRRKCRSRHSLVNVRAIILGRESRIQVLVYIVASKSGIALSTERPCGKLARRESQSARSACMTSTRAARAAGSIEATTAEPISTNAETITGNAPGIFKSPK